MSIVIVYPVIDAWLDYLTPDTNNGASAGMFNGVLYLGAAKTALHHAIGNFDVNHLRGRTINSAKLQRTIYQVTGSGGVGAKLSRCTRPATWTEGGCTWNKYDGTNAWTAGGGDVDDVTPTVVSYTEPTGTGVHEITGLAGHVTDALANRAGIVSLLTRLDNEAPATSQAFYFRTKEYDGDDRWRIVIDYSGPPTSIKSERYPIHGVQRGVMRGQR